MTTILNKLSSDYSIDKIISWITNNKTKTAGIFALTSLIVHRLSIRIYRKLTHHPPGDNGKIDLMALQHYYAKYYGAIYFVPWPTPGFDKHISITNSKLLRKIMTDKRIKDTTTTMYNLKTPFFTSKDNGEGSFSSLNGPEWSQRRKLFLSVFNKMLTTKFMNKVSGTAIKKILFAEINKICIEKGESFKIREIIQYTAFETIFYACFDRFGDPNDEFLKKFKHEIEIQANMLFKPEVIQFARYPQSEWRQKFPEVMAARDRLSELTQQLMDQRRAELKEKGIEYKNPESALSPKAYIDVNNKAEENDLSLVIKDLEFDSYLDYLLKLVDEGKMRNSTAEAECMSLFQAGYQNNSLLMEFMLVYLAKYQNLQEQVRRELYDVHNITIEERKDGDDDIIDFDLGMVNKCSLFRAFLQETLRVSSFTRQGLIRKVTRNIEIEWEGYKYKIPKGYTLGFQNETIAIVDTNQNEGWIVKEGGKIDDFNINNFLDGNKKFKLNESLSVFGFGARSCPGKAFAVKSIQIVVGYLLINYKIEFGEEEKRKDPLNAKISIDLSGFVRMVEPQIPLIFSKI